MSEQLNRVITIDCDCGTHLLRVESDVEFFGEPPERVRQDFNFAIFQYGKQRVGWKSRFWHCWHIITKGEPFADQLIFKPDEAKRLADFINENIVPTTP